jgi:acyl-CoA thioester hydrolase
MLAEYKTELIVRYAETDQMGSVHHASYLIYMEAARVEHLKAAGLPYHEMEKAGLFLPVVELAVKYHKPAKFGQKLLMTSRILPLSGIRLKVEYALGESGILLMEGYSLHAFVGRDGKPSRPPREIRQLLS